MKTKQQSKGSTKKKVINFVCIGNTCRSPMAEMVLKHCLKQQGISGFTVKSCGLSPNANDTINAMAKKALAKSGVKCGKFKSKPITLTMITSNWLILCMTQQVKSALPQLPNIKTFGEQTGFGDVLDPYGATEQQYMATCQYIFQMCNKLATQLKDMTDLGLI